MKLRVLAGMTLLAAACGAPPGTTGGDGGNGDASGDAQLRPPGAHRVAGCLDGNYDETLPDPRAAISSVPFSAADLPAFYLGILGVRYPFARTTTEAGEASTSTERCIEQYAGSPTTRAAAARKADTVVHECGHVYDLDQAPDTATNVYAMAEGVRLQCSRGDTRSRRGDTFARSLIRQDTFATGRPPCGSTSTGNCDPYAPIYLSGNPADNVFESGDQGFNMLFEEAVQYTHSLATAYAFADQIPTGSSVSARDGLLTMLWYVERYLHRARLEDTTAYARIAEDACWRQAILTLWGQAWLYLETTQGMSKLGISDAAIERLVDDPALADEIVRLRQLEGCR